VVEKYDIVLDVELYVGYIGADGRVAAPASLLDHIRNELLLLD
jgi:hypothetical protein